MTLLELPSDRYAVIEELADGDAFRKKLASLNIRAGKTIKKVTAEPFHGPVVIEIDNTEVTIGRNMAKKIVVEPLSGD